MSKISLTGMGIAFITLTFIFTGFLYNYNIASINGYDITNLNETIFNEIGDNDKIQTYLNQTGEILTEETQADKTSFDIIGNIIANALSPVRTILNGITFLITNVGRLLGYIGLPTIVSEFVTGLLVFVIGTIFLFAIILGRRDRND